MASSQRDGGMPMIPIRVELGAALEPAVNAGSGIRELIASQITKSVAGYLLEFGLPGTPRVEVACRPQRRFLRVFLNSRYSAPSTELLIVVWNRLAPLGPEVTAPLREFAEWLATLLRQSQADQLLDRLPALASFVAEVSDEIVRQHPEELFGPDQADYLLARAHLLLNDERVEALSSLDPTRLVSILRPVLGLRIAVFDQVGVLETIADGLLRSEPDEEIAEQLISRGHLQRTIRVRLNSEYLNSLIPDLDSQPNSSEPVSLLDRRVNQEVKMLVAGMRDQVFWDLGIRIPEIVFEPDPECRGRTFQIAVNHQFSRPYEGLDKDELLVEARPEEVANLSTHARPAFTPALDVAAIVSAALKVSLERAGFVTVSPLEYLMTCITSQVRRRAPCFLTTEVVETELALLGEGHSDLAVEVVREITPGRLARVLRELLREEVSIRNFVIILERLLTFDCVTADTLRHDIFDYRLARHPKLAHSARNESNLVEYVRSGLKRAITFSHQRGRSTTSVYLLHPDIESSLLDHLAASQGAANSSLLDPEQLDRIQAAIRQEADRTMIGSWAPAILTSTSIRAFVRALVADEFPGMAVLSYDELDLGPDNSVQPIAQISW